jgi:hypothetical protein
MEISYATALLKLLGNIVRANDVTRCSADEVTLNFAYFGTSEGWARDGWDASIVVGSDHRWS